MASFKDKCDTANNVYFFVLIIKACRFLILDKKSMIGLGTIHRIDQRLRHVFPEAQDQWFGGLNVLLCGDFFQLPC
jgi:PIF1-like helicase